MNKLNFESLKSYPRWLALLSGLLVGFFASQLPGWVAPQTFESGVLGQGEDWETAWQIQDSGKAGPVVLVVGGVHGNEPAGWLAAKQVASWNIKRGKLVVLPAANRLGLKANTRWFPPTRNDKQLRDLNRNFPKKERKETVTDLAGAIWAFVGQQKPDWVFDLHEGFDFHRINSKSVGSSVISFPSQKAFAAEMVEAVNRDVQQEKKFTLLAGSGPINGSLARACGEVLGAKSFILETTTKDQAISTRTRQHRQMMSFALQKLGMIEKPCVDQLISLNPDDSTKVGLFDGPGANAKNLFNQLNREKGVTVVHLGPKDVKEVIVRSLDVVMFPGGSGSKQGRSLGEAKREIVRNYVKQGGGVIGICAGAYLCSSHYDWSLHMMNAKVFNINVDVPGVGRKSMWYRGPAANVKVEVFPEGTKKLGISGTHTVRYQNGPILSQDEFKDVPDYKVLAAFRSENGIYEAQKGTMTGTPAVVESSFGGGKVMAFSPHFESTQGLERVILRAISVVQKKIPGAKQE